MLCIEVVFPLGWIALTRDTRISQSKWQKDYVTISDFKDDGTSHHALSEHPSTAMPSEKSDSQRYADEVRPKSRETFKACRLRYELKNRTSAIEHAFRATHGRAMTGKERRCLLEKIGKGTRTA